MINADELKEAMLQTDISLSDDEMNRLFDNVDYKGNKLLNYSEFIAATLSVK
jgi:Ca2+-binding EF-hand superfamily protein|tara:strand:+ start:1185 stop:1340 length:156 start_codon:yes stop_codon:yes gene_type:complete